ncbi:hypothetical protein H8356DRAFT_1318712 [Neocallimastix lanati (nom. inval.)]|nr:hypothetical protein H8356DRAFT_1318712 [Neocallimastix sp. JGI-2020a]
MDEGVLKKRRIELQTSINSSDNHDHQSKKIKLNDSNSTNSTNTNNIISVTDKNNNISSTNISISNSNNTKENEREVIPTAEMNTVNSNSSNEKILNNQKINDIKYNNPFFPSFIDYVEAIKSLEEINQNMKKTNNPEEIEILQKKYNENAIKFVNFKKEFPEIFKYYNEYPNKAKNQISNNISSTNINEMNSEKNSNSSHINTTTTKATTTDSRAVTITKFIPSPNASIIPPTRVNPFSSNSNTIVRTRPNSNPHINHKSTIGINNSTTNTISLIPNIISYNKANIEFNKESVSTQPSTFNINKELISNITHSSISEPHNASTINSSINNNISVSSKSPMDLTYNIAQNKNIISSTNEIPQVNQASSININITNKSPENKAINILPIEQNAIKNINSIMSSILTVKDNNNKLVNNSSQKSDLLRPTVNPINPVVSPVRNNSSPILNTATLAISSPSLTQNRIVSHSPVNTQSKNSISPYYTIRPNPVDLTSVVPKQVQTINSIQITNPSLITRSNSNSPVVNSSQKGINFHQIPITTVVPKFSYPAITQTVINSTLPLTIPSSSNTLIRPINPQDLSKLMSKSQSLASNASIPSSLPSIMNPTIINSNRVNLSLNDHLSYSNTLSNNTLIANSVHNRNKFSAEKLSSVPRLSEKLNIINFKRLDENDESLDLIQIQFDYLKALDDSNKQNNDEKDTKSKDNENDKRNENDENKQQDNEDIIHLNEKNKVNENNNEITNKINDKANNNINNSITLSIKDHINNANEITSNTNDDNQSNDNNNTNSNKNNSNISTIETINEKSFSKNSGKEEMQIDNRNNSQQNNINSNENSEDLPDIESIFTNIINNNKKEKKKEIEIEKEDQLSNRSINKSIQNNKTNLPIIDLTIDDNEYLPGNNIKIKDSVKKDIDAMEIDSTNRISNKVSNNNDTMDFNKNNNDINKDKNNNIINENKTFSVNNKEKEKIILDNNNNANGKVTIINSQKNNESKENNKEDRNLLSNKKNDNEEKTEEKENKQQKDRKQNTNLERKNSNQIKFSHYSKSYQEHIIRLNMRKYMKKGQNISVNNDEVQIESVSEVFNDSVMKLIKKSIDVLQEYFDKVPQPFDTMKDPYIKVYKLLTYKVSNIKELTDIDRLTRIIFEFLIKCRTEIQNTIQYCCKKLNKKPLVNFSLNNINKSHFNKKFKNYSDQDFIVISNILDYQWTAIEFLLQRMDRNYCSFRIRNKHIYPQSEHIN